MRCACILFTIITFVRCASAQNPEEYKTTIYDRIVSQSEYFIPAPPGWDAAVIGLRNDQEHQLATINFYNDSLFAFAQTGIPQISITDAVACPDSANTQSLYLLANDSRAFYLYHVASNHGVTRIATLGTDSNGLAPKRCSLEFIGAAISRDSTNTPVFYFLIHFHETPFVHKFAAFTTRGDFIWQYPIGGKAIHAFLEMPRDTAIAPHILFSTDAAQFEAADTLRLTAKKACAGALSLKGMLQWTSQLGERGTSTWLIMESGVLACAVSHNDDGALILLDPHNGTTIHFKRIASHILPRTLSAVKQCFALAELPSTIVQYDSTLKDTLQSIMTFPLDSSSAAITIPSRIENHYLLFSPSQTAMLSDEMQLIGVTFHGMTYEHSGICRFTGALLSDGRTFCAETYRGGALRAEAPNTLWWWFRYRIDAGIAVLAILIALVIFFAWERFRFYRIFYNQLVRSNASTGIIALNRQQRVIHLNKAARELLHIAPYIPMQRHITEYIANAVYTDVAAAIRECMQTRRVFEKIITIHEGAQTKTFLNRVRPTVTRGGILQGCMIQLEDISRTIERERLMNWASVAHHIAHEMKTPIGTVLLNAQHVQKNEEEIPVKTRKYLHRIITQSERLSGILQTFLRIARFNEMNFSTENVAMLVQSLAAEYAELVPQGITIRYNTPHYDLQALIDPEQLTTALRNIIDNGANAIKPNNGTITITDGSRSSETGNFIVISIRDDGKGMSETCKARLFEPFYTETPGGSGIGMMIVKRIIDEHKGFIELDSEEGKGTEIRIILPQFTNE